MRSTAILALAAASKLASAHSVVRGVFVNDVDQGAGEKGVYIRSVPNNSPITDVTSKDLTCNVGNSPASKSVEAKAGDKITFEWYHNTRGDDIIDLSHKGPVLTYIAPAESNGAGDVWQKIAEEGFSGGKWAVENLVANKGKHSATLPKDLAPGEYLLRPEIIALHEGDRLNGAQFYMSCVQVKVTEGGSTKLPAGVAIPGTYTATDPGVKFNLYSGSISSYPIPGPKVYGGGAAPIEPNKPAPSSAAPAPPAATSAAPAPPAAPTTLVTSIKKPESTSQPQPGNGNGNGNNGGVTAQRWQQCGGVNYTGPTACAQGTTCKVQNPYYSQCL